MEFSYFMPVRLLFGANVIDQLGATAKSYGTHALIVTGRSSTKRSGLLDRSIALLEAAGVRATVFNKVEPNPLTTTVMEGAALAREQGCDLVIGMGGGVGAAVLGYQMFAHVKVRVAMWRNPWSDPTDKGYQIIQALFAIGSGGLFGVGLGQGTPEKIPAYYNDFIFAVVCEQLGQVFGMLLLAVYVLLILRGVTVVSRARRSFEMLLGYGVLTMLSIQTFMIVAGDIKMIPLTGVTMPFLSYGGSSLLSCMAMIGVLHGASARAQENLEEDILCVKA